ncbi:multidrug transporter [Photobacterium leiognathi]|uniref:multidrug transporter n=1 Tax=Photobacterium leiognathi TaxID=553611 RepID=UPI00298117E5|nr:multidrug transporter [Photobacterium leiognathi]
MESKFFKVSALTAAMLGAVAMPATAEEMDVSSPVIQEEIAFFNDSTISGNVNFWFRDRQRGNVDANGKDTPKTTNLNHSSVFMNLGFNSGYIADTVGLDLVAYTTWDLSNEAFGHEMNFMSDRAGDACYSTKEVVMEDGKPVEKDVCKEKGGVSIATAALKFKFGENVNAKLGYFQPSVPSGLGVNWSFAPGTYLGGEVGANFGDLALGLVVANEYKAPWYKYTTEFADDEVLYSLGLRYNLGNNMSIDTAYSQLDERSTAHIKFKGTTAGGLYYSPQVYVVKDEAQYGDEDYGYQLALLTSWAAGPYSFRAEATYTDAGQDGNWFAYRPTQGYGGSNGAYDIWWNNRSDFNHDGEFAGFASVSRDFSDIGANGLSAGISGAFGLGAEVDGYDELKEYAASVFASYAIQSGALEGANFGMHYTSYVNDSNAPSWNGYSNAFQDESDIKVTLTIPFSAK